MSTRAVIGREAGEGKFKGVYHHWDGYPSGLGATLLELRNGHFKSNTEAMLRFLIDDHPAGWSTINGADFNERAGYDEDGPKCYCHGGRDEEGWEVTEENASGSGCEYAYVFTEDGQTMLVLSSYRNDRKKMIGMFGCGDENATWEIIGIVNLNNPEPDWKVMQEFGED